MQTTSRYALITPEALADLRSRIGVAVRRPQPHIEEITKDAIRHYAWGIGDRNPLWTDESYAAQTKHGGLLAPPTILYATDRIVSGYVGGLPGVHAMFAGTDWEWYQSVRRGDRIHASARLKDVIEKTGRFSGRTVQQVYQVCFMDQYGQLLAIADSWCFRTERDAAREAGKYVEIEPHHYSAEEIEAIKAAYRGEVIRGAEPRFWQDVVVGEELPPVVKGPFTPTSAIAYLQGWGGLYVYAHGIAFDLYERHPALAIPNAQGVPEPPERVHWDNEMARAVGVPAAYDYGPERVSWLGHLVTNWAGDDGFLRRLNVRVLRHNICGDTTWCKGTVTQKTVVDDQHLVELAVEGVNQRGEVTVAGSAVVALPVRTGE